MASVKVRRETQGTQVNIMIESAMTRGVNTLANATVRAADGTTPSRTGNLRSRNRVDRATKLGPRRAAGGVRNDTRYAAAVHDGTGLYVGDGYIRGSKGAMRWVNAGGDHSGAWIGQAVRGQPGQFFLLHAYNIARHSVGFFQPIRGFTIPAGQSAPAYNDEIQKIRKLHLASRSRSRR